MNNTDSLRDETNFNSPSGVGGASPSGYYGEFGGAYIPEILHGIVEKLKEAYFAIKTDEIFKAEYYELLKNYVGRLRLYILLSDFRKNTVQKSI